MVRHTNVKGEVPAHFHRWITDNSTWVISNKVINSKNRMDAVQRMFDTHIVDPGFELSFIPMILALIEYEDGSMDKVDPKIIRFLDTEPVWNPEAWRKNHD